MQEEKIDHPESSFPADEPEVRRGYFTRRNATIFAGGLAAVIVIFAILAVVLFRYGTVDSIIKAKVKAIFTNVLTGGRFPIPVVQACFYRPRSGCR